MSVGDKADILWKKSQENREVSKYAYKRHINACASRYNYALRLAVDALLVKCRRSAPDTIMRGTKESPNPYTLGSCWPRDALHDEAQDLVQHERFNVKELLEDAWDWRKTADYHHVVVDKELFKQTMVDSEWIFDRIGDELAAIK